MEELAEVITVAEFHPVQCNLFAYSTSKGVLKLGDMRTSALCDNNLKSILYWFLAYFKDEGQASKTFFSEIITSISDLKFSSDGRFLLSRDYMTIKIWDLNMDSEPVTTIPIHDHLRPKLVDLYENDSIFDKFECNFSGNGK